MTATTDTLKTAVTTTIAVMVCLFLLLTPDSRRIETVERTAAPIEKARPEYVEPAPVHFTPRQAAQSTPEQSTAPVVLYPELEQIRQWEDLPTHLAILELQPMLSDPDPVIRLAAIDALGDMDDPATLPPLLIALNDPGSQLRVAALEALASQQIETVAGSIEPLLYDPQREVRIAAIEALTELESHVSVHALASLLTEPDPLIRNRAVDALGDIGGRDVRAYLLQVRYDPDARVRANAEAILEELDYGTTN